jgi:hypothetical protein
MSLDDDHCKMSLGERALRRMLCICYAGHAAYMDDGEMQDNRAIPFIDFLRDGPGEIHAKMQERFATQLQAVREQQAVQPLTEDTIMELARPMCGNFRWPSSAIDLARAVERAHGI